MSQFLEVLEHYDPTGREIAYRLPPEGSAEIKFGAQLVVHEALPTLKSDRIAGVGSLATRHDSMAAGELGADYVLFGFGKASPHEMTSPTGGFPAVTS